MAWILNGCSGIMKGRDGELFKTVGRQELLKSAGL